MKNNNNKTYKPAKTINDNLIPRYGSLKNNAGLPIISKKTEITMKRAIVFVDANNWYHNVKKYFNPSEISIKKISNLICTNLKLDLKEIRWYVSVPSIADGEKMYFQHLAYLDHLKKDGVIVKTRKLQRLSNKEILKKKGNLLDSLDLCKLCKPIIEAQFLEIADIRKKEKGIDVWIATDMIRLSIIENKCDICVLISGDADFVPALELIKSSKKEVLTSSVPLGYSSEIRKKFPYFILDTNILKKCFRDYKNKSINKEK